MTVAEYVAARDEKKRVAAAKARLVAYARDGYEGLCNATMDKASESDMDEITRLIEARAASQSRSAKKSNARPEVIAKRRDKRLEKHLTEYYYKLAYVTTYAPELRSFTVFDTLDETGVSRVVLPHADPGILADVSWLDVRLKHMRRKALRNQFDSDEAMWQHLNDTADRLPQQMAALQAELAAVRGEIAEIEVLCGFEPFTNYLETQLRRQFKGGMPTPRGGDRLMPPGYDVRYNPEVAPWAQFEQYNRRAQAIQKAERSAMSDATEAGWKHPTERAMDKAQDAGGDEVEDPTDMGGFYRFLMSEEREAEEKEEQRLAKNARDRQRRKEKREAEEAGLSVEDHRLAEVAAAVKKTDQRERKNARDRKRRAATSGEALEARRERGRVRDRARRRENKAALLEETQ